MKQYTPEELNKLSKEEIVALLMQSQKEAALFKERLEELQMHLFGRSTERMECLGQESIFNEAEVKYNEEENEPEIKKSGYFFINNRGNRYTEQSIRLMLKKYTLKAGIQRKITPHMFRHSFATYLIEEGVDVSCVQQLLGHSSIKTTQIYIHVAAKKQADILRELHPRNNMNIVKVA